MNDKSELVEYWLKSLKNSDIIGREIKEKDEPLLKCLTRIEMSKEKVSDKVDA